MKTILSIIMETHLYQEFKIWLNLKQFCKTLKWLFAMMAGGLFPIWGSSILLILYSKNIQWLDFVRNGEFALYSAATLAPALYLITRDDMKMPCIDKNVCGIVIFILSGLSVLIFAGVLFTKYNQSQQNSKLNIHFLVIASLTIYILSMLILFILTLADNILTEQKINYKGLLNKDADDLSSKFDQLEDE